LRKVNERSSIGHFYAVLVCSHIEPVSFHTSLDLIWLHVLPRHGVVPDDVRQCCR
jgi:hypothetical protein